MSISIVRHTPKVSTDFPDWLQTLNIHPILKNIYCNRGVSHPDELSTGLAQLLRFDVMHDIDVAALSICKAIADNRKIMIIGDFDADGATSTALCMLALTEMGAQRVDHLVPNRFEYGYGLTPEIVDVAHAQGAQLLITVDNGISCHAGVEHAKQLGMTVIITDHHLPGEELPPADAIVNPNKANCAFPSKSIAGVGVAFYLMLAIRAQLQADGWFEQRQVKAPNLANYLDLVALGTVADVVQLDPNNRILVHQGLQRIRAGKCRPGILALLTVANKAKHQLSSTDLGFVLGPRLNAAGRLDDMSLGIACLLTHDPNHAKTLAFELDRLNQERKQIEQSMQQEAMATIDALSFDNQETPNGIVLYKDDFHAGVIGIVAGRVKEKMNRPTIVFAEESDTTIKGSARSIQGVHIRDVLEWINTRHPELIIKFGGHAMAAGLSIEKQHLAQFTRAYDEALLEWQAALNQNASIQSDGELPIDCFDIGFAEQLQYAAPWGQGFAEPVFDGQFNLIQQRIVGEKHLKMVVSDAHGTVYDAIAFNVDLNIWPNNQVSSVHLAYKLDVNEFRGKRTLQLLVSGIAL